MKDMGFLYIVYEAKFNSDKPRAIDAAPNIKIATPHYQKAKNKLRNISSGYDLTEWDIEDMEQYDYFEYQDGFSYVVVGVDKLRIE